ncbi:hypothetical protein LNP25_20140 [Klebsiella variicola subsp. variicola]|nr:hypothetical protein [Klebsiella variicola subsp. variicola]
MRAGMAAICSGADENALVSAMMGAAIAAGSGVCRHGTAGLDRPTQRRAAAHGVVG